MGWAAAPSGGSGIASYSIYASENGGAFAPLTDTTETTATFFGQSGNTYAFYSVATDNVGNIQVDADSRAGHHYRDRTQILGPTVTAPQTANVTENGSITFTNINIADVAAELPPTS